MRVIFDDEALDDLRRIFDWIAKENRRAAEKLITRIFDKAELLASPGLADMGRPGLEHVPLRLNRFPLVPAKAGTQSQDFWIPACAGMSGCGSI
jgi:plasmid stabilization system protein ParE